MNGLLSELARAPVFAAPAAGLAEDVRIQRSGMVGAALWVETRYVHLAAFRADGAGAGFSTRFTRPSRRRSGREDVVY